MVRYEAAKGSSITHNTAHKVAAEMTRLDPKGEGITARELQLAEKPVDAPLHDQFEWNDSKAALLYRDEQARGLMRAVVLVAEDEPNLPNYAARAFLAVERTDTEDEDPREEHQNAESKVYRPAMLVLKDETQAPQILQDARRQLECWRDRWRSYSEVAASFAGVFSAIDTALTTN